MDSLVLAHTSELDVWPRRLAGDWQRTHERKLNWMHPRRMTIPQTSTIPDGFARTSRHVSGRVADAGEDGGSQGDMCIEEEREEMDAGILETIA